MDIDQLIARLKEFDALRDADSIKRGSLDRMKPEYAEAWPDRLHPAVVGALEALGRSRPYQHQIEAIERSLDGDDVVMESPTASGKTLAFAVPMLDALVRDRDARALLLYPTKALALDQRGAMHELCAEIQLPGGRKIESWPYDGNVPEKERTAIRQAPPEMLMTNPEYLNMSFLAYREQWEKNGFLRNLEYIVIDEMHEYRGFFGGNMALLLRRFLLHLQHLGISPRIFMATATCANPVEHAEALTGRTMRRVSARDSLRPKREFAFINPEIPDFQSRDIFRLRIQHAALACLKEDLQTLIFCPSKKFIEEAYSRCRAACEEHGLDADLLTVFHADMKAERKEAVQQRIKEGTIRVIFSTNALELGMDIGGMDGVILAGFPTNIMSAWQQMGRAGRGWDRDAFVLFYALKDPIDRFFVGNLDAFLKKPYDRLVVDPDNEELIKNHLPSLIEENQGKFTLADRDVLGSAFYQKAVEEQAEPIPGHKPQPSIRLRGDLGQVFALKHGAQEIGQISSFRRFREAYLGAIFPFLGVRYHVRAHEENAIKLDETESYLRTDPGFFSYEKINEYYRAKRFGDVAVIYYGKLDILTSFTGYSLVDELSGEKKEISPATDMMREANRHALWIGVLERDELTIKGLSALEHLLRVGAMFVIPADRFDASTLSRERASGTGDYPTVFYYETYAGGIGVAKNLFADWETALRKGIEVANNCPCSQGCPDCIEPPKAYGGTKINKHLGIELAERILDAARMGPSHELREGLMVPVQQGHQAVEIAPRRTAAPPDEPVETLIAQGESDSVEFKATLRTNLHTGEKDRRMEDAVIKMLAGFLNTDGGTLLIGIADDGGVAGIDADEFKNEDAMSLHLTNLVRDRMNDVSLMSHVKVTFEDCDGKRVLRVVCSPSTSPAYVTEGADEVFYMRAGTATEKLTGRKMMDYINFRFGG